MDTTIVDSSSVDSRSAIYLRRRSDISTLQLAGYANAMNVKMEVVDEDVFMSGSIGGHELSEKPREDAPDTDPSESLVGAASLNPDPSPLRITLKVSQLSSKKRKHPVRGIEETLVRVKKEKIEGNGLDSTRVDTAATPLVEKVVNATAMKATASKKASSRVTPIRKKRGRPREKIVAEHVLHLIKTGKISSKNRRKVGVESFDARNRTRAVSVPAFSRTGIRKYKSQAKSPQTQRPRRAASEVATNANVKVEVRRRHESAPPVRKEEQGETCHGLETPMELESNNRDKRAFTEGLFSPPPSPALAAQGAKSATPRKACQTKEIATPDSKRKKHQRSTVSLDSINSYRTPIQAQAGSNATIQGDLDLTESDPSDAMDISDDDLGVEINPTPEYIEQKLARAAMRERLKLRDMERLSTQTIPGALLRSELDRRYAAEVLILKDGIWCVPKSCFR